MNQSNSGFVSKAEGGPVNGDINQMYQQALPAAVLYSLMHQPSWSEDDVLSGDFIQRNLQQRRPNFVGEPIPPYDRDNHRFMETSDRLNRAVTDAREKKQENEPQGEPGYSTDPEQQAATGNAWLRRNALQNKNYADGGLVDASVDPDKRQAFMKQQFDAINAQDKNKVLKKIADQADLQGYNQGGFVKGYADGGMTSAIGGPIMNGLGQMTGMLGAATPWGILGTLGIGIGSGIYDKLFGSGDETRRVRGNLKASQYNAAKTYADDWNQKHGFVPSRDFDPSNQDQNANKNYMDVLSGLPDDSGQDTYYLGFSQPVNPYGYDSLQSSQRSSWMGGGAPGNAGADASSSGNGEGVGAGGNAGNTGEGGAASDSSAGAGAAGQGPGSAGNAGPGGTGEGSGGTGTGGTGNGGGDGDGNGGYKEGGFVNKHTCYACGGPIQSMAQGGTVGKRIGDEKDMRGMDDDERSNYKYGQQSFPGEKEGNRYHATNPPGRMFPNGHPDPWNTDAETDNTDPHRKFAQGGFIDSDHDGMAQGGQVRQGYANPPTGDALQYASGGFVPPSPGQNTQGPNTATPQVNYAQGGGPGQPQAAQPISSQVQQALPADATADKIPAKLSDGEFVMDAATVRFFGAKKLVEMQNAAHEALNKQIQQTGHLPAPNNPAGNAPTHQQNAATQPPPMPAQAPPGANPGTSPFMNPTVQRPQPQTSTTGSFVSH